MFRSIANNLNNNNNNNNDNNINFIQQKQNNLNMNQNIVNQVHYTSGNRSSTQCEQIGRFLKFSESREIVLQK